MLRLFCFIMVLALIVGCGDSNVGLNGKVTFSDDGSPLTKGSVTFLKDGKIAYGGLNENGTYVVGFLKATDGLPPGRYEVYVSGAEIVHEDGTRELLIDRKYENPETSGLVLDVTAATKEFNFHVDRFQGRR